MAKLPASGASPTPNELRASRELLCVLCEPHPPDSPNPLVVATDYSRITHLNVGGGTTPVDARAVRRRLADDLLEITRGTRGHVIEITAKGREEYARLNGARS